MGSTRVETIAGHMESDQTTEKTGFNPEASTDVEAEVITEQDAKAASDTSVKPMGMGSFGEVLRNRDFLFLWSGQICSQLADKMFLVLMVLIISERFQQPGESINRWVSGIMISSTIPAILLGTVAGVYVDRWAKKPVLSGSNLLRGVLLLLTPIMLWSTGGLSFADMLPAGYVVLLGVTFIEAVLTQYFAPAEQAALPLILPKRLLLPANSLYTTTIMGSLIMGFAVGQPILAVADQLVRQVIPDANFGPELIVGGFYTLAGLLLLLPRIGSEDKGNGEAELHIWDDVRIGVRYIRETPMIRAALVQIVMLYSIFAALTVLAIRMAELIPNLEAAQFGFLLATAGIGIAIGSFWVGHGGHSVSRSKLGLFGSLGMAAMLAGLAWTTQLLWPSLILIGILGFMGALVGVPMQTLIQEETPEALRGKVFGLQNNLVNIALSLPLVLAGVAETYLGLPPVLAGLAVAAAASGYWTWRMVNNQAKPEIL